MTSNDLEDEEIEEVESFEEDVAPLQKDSVGTESSVSESGLQQHVGVPPR